MSYVTAIFLRVHAYLEFVLHMVTVPRLETSVCLVIYAFQVWISFALFFRPYLLRDAYDDMILDGVQPVRDTFHNLIVGTMKGSRLQDAFYFRDQMREMGLQPDVGPLSSLNSFHLHCNSFFLLWED